MADLKLKGYKRSDGVYGIRNHVIVLSTVCCANSTVNRICRLDDTAIPITHQHGCNHIGNDREQVLRTLAGLCNNPNIGGILLVGLGCESTGAADIAAGIDTRGKAVRTIVIQETGTIDDIMMLGRRYLAEINGLCTAQSREEFDISGLIVGLECGASDPFSGITANPAVGLVSDKLVALGATVILSEVPEMIGAEKVLERRVKDAATRQKLLAAIDDYVQTSRRSGSDLSGVNPTPGNIRAGLSTIEEKSLGCIAKGGSTEIREFINYAEKPSSRGLVIMNTPGNDPESITGMAAGGAQIILFTTGIGTPLGSPIAPVIKISSNSDTYRRMRDFTDIDAGQIIGGKAASAAGEEIFDFLVDVANGARTVAEINGDGEIAVNRLGLTF